MSIYISGHTGFVGKNLCNYLTLEGYQIKGVNLREGHRFFFPSEMKVFVHLAGKAHDFKKNTLLKEYYEVNLGLTKKVFDAFLLSDAKIFILLSSTKAVTDSIEGVLTEDTLPYPQTHYGKSKLLAENYILSKPLPEGKCIYILRPCMIHGPGNKGNLNLLYGVLSKKIPWPLAAFDNQRSFLSIDNLCFVIKELIEQQVIPSGIYHLADDESLSTNQLVKLIGEATGNKPRFWKVPKGMIKILSKAGDILPLPINTERLQKLTDNYVVSNQKISQALNKKLPLNAWDGIVKTIRSFKVS